MMGVRHREQGFTLLELVFVIAVAGALLGMALSRGAAGLDRIAVVAARDVAAAALARTRALAVAQGGSALVIRRSPAGFWLEDRRGVQIGGTDLERSYGVVLDDADTEAEIRVRYDALGIGRVASRTLRFRRGAAVATLVISSYGRVVRR